MADELNKDVVGARIKIDTSSTFKAMQNVDQAVKGNVQGFQILNKELAAAHQSYAAMAKAMDKVSLTADERRKKIQAESEALIAQRKAQTELIKAKAQTYTIKNQSEDAKLASQQAAAKKRQDAIEQQEKEHLQRMEILQQRLTKTRSGSYGGADASRERVLREEQTIRTKLAQMAERENQQQIAYAKNYEKWWQTSLSARERKEVTMREKVLMEEQKIRRAIDQNAAKQKSGLTQVGQYAITGALYYNAVRGAQEAITVIKDFERSLVDIRRVMGDDADMSFVKKSMISDAKEYGYALKEVGEVYTQIGQQGFNEQEAASLARTALMAANVEESFTSAAEAQKLMTGAILNYNMAASDSERLLDRLNEVSNNYATDSNKLLQGINRVGASAKNAGVDIDELIGYLTVLNQAGFSGSVAGNAVKSFISFSTRDIAIDKLEKYVGTIKKATGEMMPFNEILSKINETWATRTDAERHEITQAIARGDQASRFIALMNNYSKVMEVAAVSENSFGSAQRENALAMTTLEKQSQQLKAAWDELVISIGDAGLLSILKSIVREQKLLVDGFNSIPGPVRNVLTVILSAGAAIAVLNTGMRVMTGQSLIQLVTGLVNGTRAMFGFKVATDAANVSQKAFIATPLGVILTALSAVIGVATIAWSRYNGVKNEVNATMSQTERDMYALAKKYEELKKITDDNTKSDSELKQAKSELSLVIEKISGQMPELVSKWDAHGKAVEINTEKLAEFRKQYGLATKIIEEDNVRRLTQDISSLEQKVKSKDFSMNNIEKSDLSLFDKIRGKSVSDYRLDYANEIEKMGEEIAQKKRQLENSQKILELLEEKDDGKVVPSPTGTAVKPGYSEEELKELKSDFDDQMSEFRHLVNMEADGYKSAEDQMSRLREIRNQFGMLAASDLYGIDEEIYRTGQGKAVQAKGLSEATRKAFSLKLDDIDLIKKQVDMMINDSQSLIDMFSAQEFTMTDLSGKTDLYASHQSKLAEANVQLRESTEALGQRQGLLNELYAAGKITADEYNKASEEVQSRLTSLNSSINSNSIAWWNNQKAIKDIQEKTAADTFSFSEKWISQQKAIREMSVREELAAWIDVASRYEQYSEQRMTADERIYAAKKALIQEEEQALDDLVSKQKKYLEETRTAEMKDIENRKKAFTDAQDEKIKAIEKVIAAFDRTNEDDDYDKKLSEKQARLKVLEAGVGPEAIKERRDLTKEIADMQKEHERTMTKRSLESVKQSLEDEKEQKLKALEQEQQAVENHYEALLKPLDSYDKDVESKVEALKQMQIQKDGEKNAEILKNLDTFISQYQAKMSAITSLYSETASSQKDIDLQEYNSNKDRWEAAKIRGDSAEMARLQSRNNELRSKYGIDSDTGKLQQFAIGGVVKGAKGDAVPVIAHAGEMILNERQQSSLFSMLDMAVPKVNWPEPKFSAPQTTVNNYYSYDNSIGEVAVSGTNGVSGLYDQRSGLISRQQAMGRKVK